MLRRRRTSHLLGLLSLCVAFAAAAPLAAQPVAKAGFLAEGSFSLPATGSEGGIETPRGIAWSPSGEVHVVDERGGVFVFSADGAFVRRYANGALDRLSQIAIAADGSAYVLDHGARQVRIFAPDGEPTWHAGFSGDGTGGLDEPVDLALGPNGLLYVLDRGRKRIQVYSPDGTAIHEILLPTDGGDPRALGVGVTGHLYVADRDQPSGLVVLPPLTEALDVDGQPVQTGRLQLRGAELRGPVGIAVTPSGTVAVANEDDGVVWSGDAAGGAPVGTNDRLYGGEGTGRGSFRRLVDVAIAGGDEILLLDRDERKVERVSLLLESDRDDQEVMDYPVLVQRVAPEVPGAILATSPTGRGTSWFAVADREGRGLRLIEVENRDERGVYGGTIGVPAVSAGGVSHELSTLVERATDVALNDTLAVVVEENRNRFHVFDLRSGESIGTFGDNYRDERRLRDPTGVTLFRDGRVVIADRGNDRVVVFSPDLATLLGTYAVPGVTGVRLSPDDRLFVWDEDGLLAGEIPLAGGSMSPLPASLTVGGVGALTFDGNGNLYVVRKNSSRVAIMDARLDELLARLGAQADLRRGDRISVDGEGNIFTTDFEEGQSRAFRWGIDVPPLTGMTAAWSSTGAELAWDAVRGSFITGYRIVGAESPEGPWSDLLDLGEAEWSAEAGAPRWVRVLPITLTGSTGASSAPVPLVHLEALSAFEAGDWEGAHEAAVDAFALIQAGEVEAEEELAPELAWIGLYAASELGEHEAVLEWNDALGGQILQDRAFEHTWRLALAHDGLRQDDRAVVRAREAIRVARLARPRPDADRLTALHRLIYEGGLVTENWEDVASSGEALIQAAPLEADGDFLATLARAQYEVGDMARSMDLVEVAMEEPGLDEAARRELTVLAFMAAAGNGEYDRALVFAEEIGESVPLGLFTDFQITLANIRLQTDEPREAMAELLFLFEQPVDGTPLTRPLFGETVLGIYGWMVETADPATTADDTADPASDPAGDGDVESGEEEAATEGAPAAADSTATGGGPAPIAVETPADFLAALGARIPPSAETAWAEILAEAETVAAVASVERVIGEGLQHFRDGNFRGAFTFFDALEREALPDEPRLLAAEITAWALYSLNRIEDADEAYRDVFAVNRSFILDEHLDHVRETFGLEIFTDEMLEHFRAVRPIL